MKRNKEPLLLPGEEFRPVIGFVWFEISNFGRLKSRRFNHICSLGVHRGGYRLAAMAGKVRYVHRLVAETFIPNPQGLPVVHHRDSNPANNRVENLEWTTQKENIRLAMAIRGNWLLNHKTRRYRPIVRVDASTGERVKFASIRLACDAINVLTVAAGGVAKPTGLLAPNLCHARDSGGIAYGFRWSGR